ncbi:MAG TPA: alpha/beta hydrolase family protein [Acidimicrobiales bacterium]|jgi:S-formylglutathione hydrolase FrmB|nr:alpha/beta hydrolase family protein [Acidimicrobiales bacterium]
MKSFRTSFMSGVVAWCLVGLTAGPVGAAVRSAAPAPIPTLSDGNGLHVSAEQQLDPRLLALTVTTTALAHPANVRILLPAEYAANPTRRYPVLYLFDGTSGQASDWTTSGDAEEITAGLPVIVVMPDITYNGNGGGWCTNSVNGGKYGQPQWETFHIDQLIPWVDQNFRTVASRDGRAIAGLSQGGFCSMSYAAQFPDMFVTALAFSGAPEIAYDPAAQIGATAIINATEVGLTRVPVDSFFGNPVTDEINWAAHDPATLANNLRGMNLLLYNGNGLPGPLDTVPNPGGSAIEGLISFDNQYFHRRLAALHIPNYWDDYGPGTHSWPYWARDLRQSIGTIMDDFAHPPACPSTVTYTTANPLYSEFGWTVGIDRTAEEFSTLGNADRDGFALSGSGAAVVRTAPLFQPGKQYTVDFASPTVHVTLPATADPLGQLTLVVPLGPANPFQQYTAGALAVGTKTYTTEVTIHP